MVDKQSSNSSKRGKLKNHFKIEDFEELRQIEAEFPSQEKSLSSTKNQQLFIDDKMTLENPSMAPSYY
eukprot:CAMPEP_0170560262 /NCGR_PEP_ID=MMETSP0211-20121228/47823_1 /TAXON_ID=311385 /ORGANISM="Pseudokeronopsis sp., Strain OXSARD2" /LENGTH=67 /DNA_ID=CAMNT_0010874237 /DNA_START=1253 /DNA_END=1456 /DNA_ORIENTATION=+